MRIALAQINPVIGDFTANQKLILEYARKAKDEAKCDLVLFPELSLCGAPLLDLVKQVKFAKANKEAFEKLAESLPGDIAVGLGYVKQSPFFYGNTLLNVYGIIHNKKIVFEQMKKSFIKNDVFEFKGERIGIILGSDVWHLNDAWSKDVWQGEHSWLTKDIINWNLSLLCIPSAFPYITGNYSERLEKIGEINRQWNIPVINVNMVGANDAIIFDGRSFVTTASGSVLAAKSFEEDLLCFNYSTDSAKTENQKIFETSFSANDPDELENALVLGIRDYMKKCGFTKAHLGLSGGIDSALVACLAAKAAGAENIVCLNMPSRFSSRGSKDDSKELAENLGVKYEVISIEPMFEAALSSMEGFVGEGFVEKEIFENKPFGIAEENIQARIRGVLLMAYSSKFNYMLLAAGNKSETAMGYCTMYGDTNGALMPIGDIFKTEVYSLCKRINERSIAETGKAIIPQSIIDKPPSAELRPDQKDQDFLPPYDLLDEVLSLILYRNLSMEEIIAMGFDKDIVSRIIRTIARSEWKIRQLPPFLKVSEHSFSMDRKMPIARAVYET